MKLYEFFSVPSNKDADANPRDAFSSQLHQDDEKLADEVYWYILDDDDFNKEYFLPLAHEIAKMQKSKQFDHGKFTKRWMPLVNKACVKYYHEHELSGDPKDVFSFEMRKGLSQRLADQHHKDIESGEYKLG